MKRLTGLLSIVFLLSPLFSHAAEAPAGSIKTVKGTASIIRQDQVIPAQIGEIIFMGDSLKTGSDGTVGIIFKDDTLISIGPRSEIVISEFLFSPAEGKLSIVTKLLRGTAAYLTGIIAKLSPESVRFETPVAIIGVRGTKFLVQIENSDSEAP